MIAKLIFSCQTMTQNVITNYRQLRLITLIFFKPDTPYLAYHHFGNCGKVMTIPELPDVYRHLMQISENAESRRQRKKLFYFLCNSLRIIRVYIEFILYGACIKA